MSSARAMKQLASRSSETLTREEAKLAIDNHNSRYYGLSWMTTSKISTSTKKGLLFAPTDKSRFNIATLFMKAYPRKALTNELRKILFADEFEKMNTPENSQISATYTQSR